MSSNNTSNIALAASDIRDEQDQIGLDYNNEIPESGTDFGSGQSLLLTESWDPPHEDNTDSNTYQDPISGALLESDPDFMWTGEQLDNAFAQGLPSSTTLPSADFDAPLKDFQRGEGAIGLPGERTFQPPAPTPLPVSEPEPEPATLRPAPARRKTKKSFSSASRRAIVGGTTRGAKIRDYDPSQTYGILPEQDRDWRSRNYSFTYHANGALSEPSYTVAELMEFLLDRPAGSKLTLWVQKAPADAAKRHFTSVPYIGSGREPGAVCLCASCPLRSLKDSSIRVGSFRVAIDEYTDAYPHVKLDPFQVSGYLHLYCMERFFNLPELVERGIDIRPDARPFPEEPTGQFAGTLADRPEFSVAKSFLSHCAAGTLASFAPQYPTRDEFAGLFGAHRFTLTYLLNASLERNRKESEKKQLRNRNLSGGQAHVHLGDLEVYAIAQGVRFNRKVSAERRKYHDRACDPWKQGKNEAETFRIIEAQGNDYDIVQPGVNAVGFGETGDAAAAAVPMTPTRKALGKRRAHEVHPTYDLTDTGKVAQPRRKKSKICFGPQRFFAEQEAAAAAQKAESSKVPVTSEPAETLAESDYDPNLGLDPGYFEI
ncbi:hypothetical protein H2203_000515 [Taxawa tesnikishii (nom. ined.)]|nr:hypothetical protein H2203_000515 [Dothideales sp. JES 119]